ncbi:MAG TPA: hypothetical protein VKD26_05185 [Streptosporangiaceae bacterium]|nr:hypothetical protein [Streptosporangiaceae bacterium]
MRGRLRNGRAGSGRGGRRQRSRRTGCLLWILVLFLVVIILGLLFGGFRKGTKTGSGGLRAPISALRAERPQAPAEARAWTAGFVRAAQVPPAVAVIPA